jgi:hypothetical protein
MRFSYKGRSYNVQPGTEIEVYWIDDQWQPATVEDMLSAQLTATVMVDGEPLTYRLFTDMGETWKPCPPLKEYLDV